jgi:septum formation topological specificity factor MinE
VSFDPESIDLDALFVDPAMFDSRAAWSAASFEIIAGGGSPTACMVAAHASAPGYLFKKFTRAVSRKDQNENYEARVKGARKLAKFVAKKRLRHVVVPRKILRDLPRRFGKRARVLVVERLDILGPEDTARRYRSIVRPVLRDLLAVLAKYAGLDSTALNVPFLRDGRIAFVDLEHWERRKRTILKTLGGYLTAEDLALSRKVLDR